MNPGTGHWEIVSLQLLARRCKAKTTAAVKKSDSTFIVDTVVALDDGQVPPLSGSPAGLTIDNADARWAGISGQEIEIQSDFEGSSTTAWKFLTGPMYAILYSGTTTGGVKKTDGSFSVNSIAPIDGGVNLLSDVSSVTIQNTGAWATKTGTTCTFTNPGDPAGTNTFENGPDYGRVYRGTVTGVTPADTPPSFNVTSTGPVDGGIDLINGASVSVNNWAGAKIVNGTVVQFINPGDPAATNQYQQSPCVTS
jgi:hypothetical protein